MSSGVFTFESQSNKPNVKVSRLHILRIGLTIAPALLAAKMYRCLEHM